MFYYQKYMNDYVDFLILFEKYEEALLKCIEILQNNVP
jgi:hypothetical protein